MSTVLEDLKVLSLKPKHLNEVGISEQNLKIKIFNTIDESILTNNSRTEEPDSGRDRY